MTTFILVHGAYHGAWCWQRLTPLLEARGDRVIAPDLPGHGDDRTPLADVDLGTYVARIDEILAAQPEVPVLVGHSMAGIILSTIAERRPGDIAKLIYLTAYMLADGETLSAAAKVDAESLVKARIDEVDGAPCVVPAEGVLGRAFYQDASDEDLNWVAERITPQPIAPFREPVRVSSDRWGRVPRLYIHCRDDRAISPTLQERMVAAQPGTPTAELAGGHSPFLTRPEELAGLLSKL